LTSVRNKKWKKESKEIVQAVKDEKKRLDEEYISAKATKAVEDREDENSEQSLEELTE
jgi:hypothetical protein